MTRAAPIERALLFGTERYAIPILAPLAAALAARGVAVRWFLHGLARDTAVEAARLHEPGAVKPFAPDVVFSAANWVPPSFRGLKVQVFHGFSIDKRDAGRGHFRIRGWFDLYCTQGPSTTGPFAALAREHAHFRVVETGWPKLDPLFGPAPAIVDAIRAAARGRRIVMFGSTFTPRLAAAPRLLPEIARLVADGRWYFVLTLHPKTDPSLIARYRALAGPDARYVETEEVVGAMRAADALVADTSSIVAEFAVQRRPVVTLRNRKPQPHMIDIDEPAELERALERALAPGPELAAALDAYGAAIHPHRDGRSSERVIDAAAASLAAGRAELRAKPLNLLRRLQYAWKLRRG